MTYRVIKSFTDMQDNGYMYHVGDLFPRMGFNVSAERIEELSTDKNRRRTPLIEAVAVEKPKPEKEEPTSVIEAKKEVEKPKTKPKQRKKS